MTIPVELITAVIACISGVALFLLATATTLLGWILIELVKMKTSMATLCQRVGDLPCHPNGAGKSCKAKILIEKEPIV